MWSFQLPFELAKHHGGIGLHNKKLSPFIDLDSGNRAKNTAKLILYAILASV